jgi:hypothetical protein
MKLEYDPTLTLVRVNAPEVYRDPAFVEWLNDTDTVQATWHKKGAPPSDFSDLFFTYDAGEGSNSDMPGHIWDKICDLIKEHEGEMAYCLVWMTNLEE